MSAGRALPMSRALCVWRRRRPGPECANERRTRPAGYAGRGRRLRLPGRVGMAPAPWHGAPSRLPPRRPRRPGSRSRLRSTRCGPRHRSPPRCSSPCRRTAAPGIRRRGETGQAADSGSVRWTRRRPSHCQALTMPRSPSGRRTADSSPTSPTGNSRRSTSRAARPRSSPTRRSDGAGPGTRMA